MCQVESRETEIEAGAESGWSWGRLRICLCNFVSRVFSCVLAWKSAKHTQISLENVCFDSDPHKDHIIFCFARQNNDVLNTQKYTHSHMK